MNRSSVLLPSSLFLYNPLITFVLLSVIIFIEYDLEMIKVWQKQSWDKQGQVIIVLPPPPLMFGNNTKIQNIVNKQQPWRLSHDAIWMITLVLSKYHYETFNNDVSVSVIRICCSTQKEYYYSAWDKHEILMQHCEREIIILV